MKIVKFCVMTGLAFGLPFAVAAQQNVAKGTPSDIEYCNALGNRHKPVQYRHADDDRDARGKAEGSEDRVAAAPGRRAAVGFNPQYAVAATSCWARRTPEEAVSASAP